MFPAKQNIAATSTNLHVHLRHFCNIQNTIRLFLTVDIVTCVSIQIWYFALFHCDKNSHSFCRAFNHCVTYIRNLYLSALNE